MLGLVLLGMPGVAACDLCAIYSSAEATGESGRGFQAGVSEQFTYFGTLQLDGERVSDPVHYQSTGGRAWRVA